MLRAYHFPFEDLRSDEDTIAGNALPWRIGEIRAYTPITIDAGDGETISEPGYRVLAGTKSRIRSEHWVQGSPGFAQKGTNMKPNLRLLGSRRLFWAIIYLIHPTWFAYGPADIGFAPFGSVAAI